ncbi:hypothetical protein BOX15_Mlig017301g1, partial [Macrostomum lignano]
FCLEANVQPMLSKLAAMGLLLKSQCSCRISTTVMLHKKMKFSYQQGHAWITAVRKHQRRADNPWVPREMPDRVAIAAATRGGPSGSRAFSEARPELVVPDLTGFQLKPYVDWAAKYGGEPELTAERLFELTYAKSAGVDS